MKYKTSGSIIYKQRGVGKIKVVCIEIEMLTVKIMGVREEIRIYYISLKVFHHAYIHGIMVSEFCIFS
jgi:hypothetical protein